MATLPETISNDIWPPIGPGEFRLIEVQQVDPEIQAEFLVCNVSNCTDYGALSYAWDGQISTRKIAISGSFIPVTQTVHEALSSIFNLYGKFRIFVDSISINQEDAAEKASQVAQMHKIYRHATGVIIWLGPAANNSDLAMDFITSLEGALPTLIVGLHISEEVESFRNLQQIQNMSPDLVKAIWYLG